MSNRFVTVVMETLVLTGFFALAYVALVMGPGIEAAIIEWKSGV